MFEFLPDSTTLANLTSASNTVLPYFYPPPSIHQMVFILSALLLSYPLDWRNLRNFHNIHLACDVPINALAQITSYSAPLRSISLLLSTSNHDGAMNSPIVSHSGHPDTTSPPMTCQTLTSSSTHNNHALTPT